MLHIYLWGIFFSANNVKKQLMMWLWYEHKSFLPLGVQIVFWLQAHHTTV